MFGKNDNDSQPALNSQLPGDSPAPTNPFGETDVPVPAPPPPVTPAPLPPSDLPAQAVDPPSVPSGSTDLLDLKQQALQKLQPLVSHLEQSPEEKFKTTMMLIQATDNSALVQQAYEAANQITDEKARAQALLDVVNEINYFTHNQTGSETKAS